MCIQSWGDSVGGTLVCCAFSGRKKEMKSLRQPAGLGCTVSHTEISVSVRMRHAVHLKSLLTWEHQRRLIFTHTTVSVRGVKDEFKSFNSYRNWAKVEANEMNRRWKPACSGAGVWLQQGQRGRPQPTGPGFTVCSHKNKATDLVKGVLELFITLKQKSADVTNVLTKSSPPQQQS